MSLITDLPAIFDQFSEARQKGFLTVMDLKEQGIPPGGNLLHLHAAGDPDGGGWWWSRCAQRRMKPSKKPKKIYRATLCPLIKSSYGFGKTDKCPYFYFSDLVVGETTCDGKKKMYEYMAEFKAVHVMQLPNSSQDAARSRALWKAEIPRSPAIRN